MTNKVLQIQVTNLRTEKETLEEVIADTKKENEILKTQKESLEDTNARQQRSIKDLENRINTLSANGKDLEKSIEENRRLTLIIGDLHKAINNNNITMLPDREKLENEIYDLRKKMSQIVSNSEFQLLTLITQQRNLFNGNSSEKLGFAKSSTD